MGVAVGLLAQLRVAHPVPFVFNSPALTDQSQQDFWGGTQAGDKSEAGDFALALAGSCAGDQLHEPVAARSVGLDALWKLLGPKLPASLAPVALFEIRCCESDLALSLELQVDLPVERLLVGFHGQQEVALLLLAPAKNSCVVCSASAWIKTPLRSSLPSSSLGAVFSLDACV
jgi:hypothetical protein